MKAVILAGGLGKRIQKAYPNAVKSLLRFNGRPFIHYQLKLLEKYDFKDVLICAGYGANEIRQFIATSRYDMNVEVMSDGKTLLGTGGAIRNALPVLGFTFSVIYGDSYLNFDYDKAITKFLHSDRKSLMTIYENNGKLGKSNVKYNGRKIVGFDKVHPTKEYTFIDYGANFFTAAAFEDTPRVFDLADLQKSLLAEDELDHQVIKDRFYEVGSIRGINDFQKMLNSKHVYK